MVQFSNLNIYIGYGQIISRDHDVFIKQLYTLNIKTYFPETTAVEELVNSKGPNSFYESVENRKMFHSQSSAFAQSITRKCNLDHGLKSGTIRKHDLALFEYDAHFEIIKFNPLLNGPCRKWKII
jgi:phosphoadenosine phosphosulfate reductase